MKADRKTRVILVTRAQFSAIEQLQQQEAQQSSTGAAPSIHAIARALLDKGLSIITTSQEKT